MSPPYVVGDSSPFLKRVLIPFWVIRIIIMVIQIGVYGVLIAGLGVFKDDVQRLWNEYNTSLSYDAVLGIAVVILLIVLLCLILDLVCIIKRARRTLSPPFFLGVNIAQSVFYLVNFILSMVGASSGPLAIAISVIILLSFLGLLIYAGVVFHQYRKGTLSYAPAHNPEAHKLVVQNHTAYQPQTTYPQPYAQDYPQTGYYDPQAAAQPSPAHAGQGYAGQNIASPGYAAQSYPAQPQQRHQQSYETNPHFPNSSSAV